MEVQISRCTTCRDSGGDSVGRCSYVSNGTSKFWLRRNTEKLDSYDLFSTDMGSIRTGNISCQIFKGDHDSVMKNRGNINLSIADGAEATIPVKSRSNLQSPEYVKRTAKLFETVGELGDPEPEIKNGVDSCGGEPAMGVVKVSRDFTDGEINKKPSYLGVSCSNSGYRNVINYNSKLREGFHSANSPRESLMVSSSRLRENSPLRRDVEFIYRNGKGVSVSGSDSYRVTVEKEETTSKKTTANGISQFVNISTSTKTISTFRNSKELENNVSHDGKSNGEANVNLKQILNGKNEASNHRRGYSNLGFSPKILKSPEKNCNSFLKSISSFENNSQKLETRTRTTSSYSRGEQTAIDSINSIRQRIERLYGPGALAQGFYAQKPKGSDKMEESPASNRLVERLSNAQSGKISLSALTKPMTQASASTKTTPNGNSLSLDTEKVTTTNATNVEEAVTATPSSEVATTEKPEEESQQGDLSNAEKNGLYFLKLLKKETDQLDRLASFAEKELENGENLPEEINGKLRAAAGKARLLVCQKLHQFEGLCHKNMNEKPSEPFPTTSEDLAGFWDMVMLQVVQVYGVFDELEELKKNNWKVSAEKSETVSPSPTSNSQASPAKTTPKKSTPTSSTKEKSSEKAEAAKKAREETRRKMLEERRRKMKELKENKINNGGNESGEDGVEIFAK